MRTAIDANLISAIWGGEPSAQGNAELLAAAQHDGGLVISGPVYAELLAYPSVTREAVDHFLTYSGIAIEFETGQEVWVVAGAAYASYASLRRKSAGGEPKRLLVDFVVGAHALQRADRLATLDRSRYAQAFPQLVLIG